LSPLRLSAKPVCRPGAVKSLSHQTTRKPPAAMLVVAGKTNLRGLPSSVRLHPPRLTALPLVLQSSIQSGNFRPFVTAPALSAMTSFNRTAPGGGGAVRLPGEPVLLVLARQLAGSSSSPEGSIISSDEPASRAAAGQPVAAA